MQNHHASVRFGADTSGFRRRLQEMTGLSRQQVNLLTSIFAGFSVRGMYRQLNSIINSLDEIGKGARALGVTTTEFQQLEYASNRTGGSIRQTETALSRMARAIGDAERGQAKAVDSLSELNLRYEDLIGLDLVSQFKLIGDRINRVDDQQRRLNLAQEFFGRQGKVILDMASNYGTLAKEAERTIIGEDHIKAAEDFRDTMLDLGKAIKKTVVDTGFLPWLSDVADAMGYWFVRNQDSLDHFTISFEQLLASFRRMSSEGLEIDVKPLLTQIAIAEAEITRLTSERARSHGYARFEIDQEVESLKDMVAEAQNMIKHTDRYNAAAKRKREEDEERLALAADQAAAEKAAAEADEERLKILEQHNAIIERNIERIETAARVQELRNQGLEDEADLLNMLGAKYEELSDSEYNRLIALTARLRMTKEAAEEMIDVVGRAERFSTPSRQWESLRSIGGGFAATGASTVSESDKIARQQLDRLNNIRDNTREMARQRMNLAMR